MKSPFLSLLVALTLSTVLSAQTKTQVRIKSDSRAGVTITSGAKSVRVDLSKDIAGSAFIAEGKYKRDLRKRGCEAGPAKFELVDATVKDGETFVVLFSRAFGNSNVCGQCGASGAHSLVLIRLSKSFTLVTKQSVTLESCFDNVALIQPSWENTVEGSVLSGDVKFVFDRDRLTVKYEKSIYENGDSSYQLSTLVYDRGNPTAGFAVSVKTSKESSAPNQ